MTPSGIATSARVSGALDRDLMSAANALLANDANAAVLDVCLDGPTLQALSGPVRSVLADELSGKRLHCRIGSICVHGDGPEAVATARLLRDRLLAEACTLVAVTEMSG